MCGAAEAAVATPHAASHTATMEKNSSAVHKAMRASQCPLRSLTSWQSSRELARMIAVPCAESVRAGRERRVWALMAAAAVRRHVTTLRHRSCVSTRARSSGTNLMGIF